MTLMAGFVQNTEYYEKLVELSLQLFQFFSYGKKHLICSIFLSLLIHNLPSYFFQNYSYEKKWFELLNY